MKLQPLVQPSHSACPSVISDDSSYCFVPGVPLSIHTYSTHNAVLLSTYTLPTSSDTTRLVAIHKHPHFPNHQLVLVASDGTFYVYDFQKSCLLASYRTGLPIIFSRLRQTSIPTHEIKPGDLQPTTTPLTLFVVAQKPSLFTISDNKSKVITKRHVQALPGTRPKEIRIESTLFAVRLHALVPGGRQQTAGRLEGKYATMKMLKTAKATCFSASTCGNWLGIVTGTSIWLVRLIRQEVFENWNMDEQKTEPRFQAVHLKACEKITSIAFPPKSHLDHFTSPLGCSSIDLSCMPCDYFATGSSAGRIALWHALSESQWKSFVKETANQPSVSLPCPTSVSHWHAHAVADLAFTRNGSYLISGGEEAVVVLWRLDDFEGVGQDSKSFLARLRSPIQHLSLIDRLPTNEPGVMVTTKDGRLLLVSTASMSITKTLRLAKMNQLPQLSRRRTCLISSLSTPLGSKLDPSRPYGLLMVPSSHQTTLHVLDGGSGDLMNEINVTPKNIVSRRDDRSIVEPVLTHVALGGQRDRYMATIDSWHDTHRGFEPEITLKLWERDSENAKNFNLIARVDNPHEDEITSLNFSPAAVPSLVTTSTDGTIKLWSFSQVTTRSKPIKPVKPSKLDWLKSSSLSYRALDALDSSFSEDGTVMAVLHSQCVSIWNIPEHQLLKTVGSGSRARLGVLRKVCFVGASMNKLMILGRRGFEIIELTASKENGVWKSPIDHILRIPHSDYIVAFSKSTERKQAVEDPTQPSRPGQSLLNIIDISLMKLVYNTKVRATRAAVFVKERNRPPTSKHELLDGLVLYTVNGGLFRFGEDVFELYAASAAAEAREADPSTRMSLPFKELLSHQSDEGPPLDEFTLRPLNGATGGKELREMFESLLSMPPHLIPPSRMIWSNLLVPTALPTSNSTFKDSRSSETEPAYAPSSTNEHEEDECTTELEIPIPTSGMRPITIKELDSPPLPR
ncbi:hypothetical protein CROQUDRAFT_61088 [Cronartium quercuum f. sp. fusiforme G11]|uniref:WD repeat-containing protein 75 second beta-propeller domain-containing protein n=1 Tax=Cronartium quercuum f. sp. fusiforme G11 TaxID=708437 RepID=A0A9P6TDS4_9BASI|nr:hypothetical protein CROQUDRAFT_61088 [Cronartium quercuum f. sp. fusiforme G11]